MNGLVCRLVLAGGMTLGFASFTDTLYAAGVSVEQATAAQKKDAQAAFLKAMQDYEAKKLDKALAGFQASYNIVASPNSHYMIARTLRDMNKANEAAAEYQGVIAEAGTDQRYADTLNSAKGEFDELKTKLAFVAIELNGAPPDAKVEVGGKPVDGARLKEPMLVEPGDITVVVKSSKGEMKKTVTAALGKTATAQFDFLTSAPVTPIPAATDTGGVKADSKKMTLKQWSYVAGGVGAVGLITFGVFGLMNQSKYDKLKSDCNNGPCPTDRSDDISTGRTYQTVANVGLVVGILGVGTGVALYVIGSKKKPEQPAARWSMPQVAVGPGSLLISGKF
jgi:hypothetical protein